MSKRPTPKKKRARSQTSRQHKAFQNRARKQLSGMVDAMLKLEKNPNYLRLTQELEGKKEKRVTKIKA